MSCPEGSSTVSIKIYDSRSCQANVLSPNILALS